MCAINAISVSCLGENCKNLLFNLVTDKSENVIDKKRLRKVPLL